MIFRESQDCFNLGLRAGAIVFRGVKISEAGAELRSEIAAAVGAILARFSSPAEIRALPEILKHHEILKKVGVKPRKHLPSVENLLRFALKREALPSVNSLVDAYNLISVETRCSLGAHDLDRLVAPVELRLFRGDETFTPLGSKEAEDVVPGEFGYVDARKRVICRLDVLQADFSKVTVEATNILLIIEATTAHDRPALEKVFAETAQKVGRYCGGEAEVVAFPY